jgi:chemotaxis protein methyltransferase CheR
MKFSCATHASVGVRANIVFHLIVARHALATYNRVFVYHAHQVIYESLVRLGFLALGTKESLRFTPHQKAYDGVPQTVDFYRRIR